MQFVGVIIAIFVSIAALAFIQTAFAVVAGEFGEITLDLNAFNFITVRLIRAVGAILMTITAMRHGQALARRAATELTVQGFSAATIRGIAIYKAGGAQTCAIKLSGTDTHMRATAVGMLAGMG